MSSLSAAARKPVYVGPVPVANAGSQEVVDTIVRLHQEGRGARVATANADFVALARLDAQLRRDLENCTVVVADGAPVAWLARAAGGKHVERLAGVDLPLLLIEALRRAGSRQVRVATYGSTPQVAAAAAVYLASGTGEALVAPVICPPFGLQSPEEVAADLSLIAAARPDLVLVALGCPKQERFIAEHFEVAPGAIWIGIGGSLDFYAGCRRRAPRWAQRVGLEWLVRLSQEPRRLWQRYLVRDLRVLFAVAPGCILKGISLRRGGQQLPLN